MSELIPPLDPGRRVWASKTPRHRRAHRFARHAGGVAISRCGKVRAPADALFEPGVAQRCAACERYAAVDEAR